MDEPTRPVTDSLPTFTVRNGGDEIVASGGVCAPVAMYYDLFNPSAAATGPARPLTLRERLERYKNRKVDHLRRRVGHWVAGVPLDDYDPWD